MNNLGSMVCSNSFLKAKLSELLINLGSGQERQKRDEGHCLACGETWLNHGHHIWPLKHGQE